MPVTLHRSDDVTVLDLGDDQNRMSPDWLYLVGEALDEVVASAPGALVTTASGRFFSNGLDLEWLGGHLDEYDAYLGRVQRLMARFLTLPVPTLAALPGHAFGMGAVLALTHDTRTMRTDRGYFCFPEIDLGLQFTPFHDGGHPSHAATGDRLGGQHDRPPLRRPRCPGGRDRPGPGRAR
ncbi:enoyl-CoA hydratase-related protein [Nocardioides sp. TF02-7]|uniref:enoyl-CoA hydratase-related protein n=1 Tax=Nocardioides sp. TF02-7 TaxID=2917724 RepID=UPI001F05B6DE|nr:enoyl-CoA hydratase-related protein [Nocardioides sp. TF02-7]UMG94125.1 enoyl-CoA hydratase-related protein [Nocardioides sp. TF02-7]